MIDNFIKFKSDSIFVKKKINDHYYIVIYF